MIETIQYGIKSVGHEPPSSEQKCVVPKGYELLDVFNTWVNKEGGIIVSAANIDPVRGYSRATELLERCKKVTVAEAHQLVFFLRQQRELSARSVECVEVGTFLSAVYNLLVDEQVIVFDIPGTEIGYLGLYLKKDKLLINTVKIGDMFGSHSNGVVINDGIVDGWLGASARGIVINFGQSIGGYDGINLQPPGIFVNLGKPGKEVCSNSEGKVIMVVAPETYGENLALWQKCTRLVVPVEAARIPQLHEYFVDLRQKVDVIKQNFSEGSELLREFTRARISSDLEQILRKAGYKW